MKTNTLENKFKKNHFFFQILTDIPKKSVIFVTHLIFNKKRKKMIIGNSVSLCFELQKLGTFERHFATSTNCSQGCGLTCLMYGFPNAFEV